MRKRNRSGRPAAHAISRNEEVASPDAFMTGECGSASGLAVAPRHITDTRMGGWPQQAIGPFPRLIPAAAFLRELGSLGHRKAKEQRIAEAADDAAKRSTPGMMRWAPFAMDQRDETRRQAGCRHSRRRAAGPGCACDTDGAADHLEPPPQKDSRSGRGNERHEPPSRQPRSGALCCSDRTAMNAGGGDPAVGTTGVAGCHHHGKVMAILVPPATPRAPIQIAARQTAMRRRARQHHGHCAVSRWRQHGAVARLAMARPARVGHDAGDSTRFSARNR